jgi:hypothetical protein
VGFGALVAAGFAVDVVLGGAVAFAVGPVGFAEAIAVLLVGFGFTADLALAVPIFVVLGGATALWSKYQF